MKRITKMLSMSFVAVLAVAAFAAANASASQPKFVTSGGFGQTVTATGGAGKLETIANVSPKRTINCEKNSAIGEIANSTELGNVSTKFTGCTATGPFGVKASCKSPGAASKEIQSNGLKGKLVYGPSDEVLLLISTTNTLFTEITCEAFGVVQELFVRGEVLGVPGPVNTPTTTFTLSFSQSAGVQGHTSYKNPTGCAAVNGVTLETEGKNHEKFAFEQSAIEGSGEGTVSEEIEIEASKCE